MEVSKNTWGGKAPQKSPSGPEIENCFTMRRQYAVTQYIRKTTPATTTEVWKKEGRMDIKTTDTF